MPKGSGVLRIVWRYARWVLLVLIICLIGLTLLGNWDLNTKKNTADAVASIQSRHLALSDVDGKHLPPPPDSAQVNATVAGMDANDNGIRDDVELAIFKLHPDSARIRAAELQYVISLQVMLTKVFDTNTWVAAAQNLSRGSQCIFNTFPKDPVLATNEISKLSGLVVNTPQRKIAKDEAYKFTISYGDRNLADCDIDLNSLPI